MRKVQDLPFVIEHQADIDNGRIPNSGNGDDENNYSIMAGDIDYISITPAQLMRRLGVDHIKVGLMVIMGDGRTLVVWQNCSKCCGFPKGTLEITDKNIVDRLCKEVYQETGYEINARYLVDNHQIVQVQLDNSEGRPENYIFFYVKYSPKLFKSVGRVQDRDEILMRRWVHIEQLKEIRHSNITLLMIQFHLLIVRLEKTSKKT